MILDWVFVLLLFTGHFLTCVCVPGIAAWVLALLHPVAALTSTQLSPLTPVPRSGQALRAAWSGLPRSQASFRSFQWAPSSYRMVSTALQGLICPPLASPASFP